MSVSSASLQFFSFPFCPHVAHCAQHHANQEQEKHPTDKKAALKLEAMKQILGRRCGGTGSLKN
jgi:hypothetical protein